MLTREEIDKYVLNKKQTCPYCGKSMVFAKNFGWVNNDAYTTVVCRDCNKQWKEIYTFKTIEDL